MHPVCHSLLSRFDRQRVRKIGEIERAARNVVKPDVIFREKRGML